MGESRYNPNRDYLRETANHFRNDPLKEAPAARRGRELMRDGDETTQVQENPELVALKKVVDARNRKDVSTGEFYVRDGLRIEHEGRRARKDVAAVNLSETKKAQREKQLTVKRQQLVKEADEAWKAKKAAKEEAERQRKQRVQEMLERAKNGGQESNQKMAA